MKAFLLIALLQGQPAPVAPAPAPSPAQTQGPNQPPTSGAPVPEPERAAVGPYARSLREGRRELAELSGRDRHDEARALAASLLAKPDFDAQPEVERAEALYAIGVALGRSGATDAAVEAFHRCLGLAGSSELGRDAAYDAGTYRLLAAEELRLQIPELRQKLQLPPLAAAPPVPPAPSGGNKPDPLQLARAAYLEARGELAGRWRADPADADTRANLELIQRRLRELDELQQQRDEQKQQQQKDQQQQDQQQDPQSSDQPSDDQQKDKDQQQKPKEGDKPPESPEPRESDPKEQASQPEKSREEMVMTPEEVQRLLDQMDKIDKRAREVQALLRESRRTPVKKDW